MFRVGMFGVVLALATAPLSSIAASAQHPQKKPGPAPAAPAAPVARPAPPVAAPQPHFSAPQSVPRFAAPPMRSMPQPHFSSPRAVPNIASPRQMPHFEPRQGAPHMAAPRETNPPMSHTRAGVEPKTTTPRDLDAGRLSPGRGPNVAQSSAQPQQTQSRAELLAQQRLERLQHRAQAGPLSRREQTQLRVLEQQQASQTVAPTERGKGAVRAA